jgi:putative membrane protein
METWEWHHGFAGGGLIMVLIWILVVVVVAVLVYGLLRDRGAGREPPTGSAKQILQERYARGEIERDEYLNKLRDLGG